MWPRFLIGLAGLFVAVYAAVRWLEMEGYVAVILAIAIGFAYTAAFTRWGEPRDVYEENDEGDITHDREH